MRPYWLACYLLAVAAFSQSASVDRATSANDLARAVVANELKSQDANHSRWMCHVDREEQGKKKAKEVVQTGQGSLDRLVGVDGHPLNDHEQQQEKKRIEDLVRNPRGTTATRTIEEKRCGAMQVIFQDDSRCFYL
jgi:hypothetical protein